MTDQRISELPAATLPLTGLEKVPVVQDGVNKNVNVAQFTGDFSGYAPGTYLCPTLNSNVSRTVQDNLMVFTPFIIPARAIFDDFSQRSSNAPGTAESWALAIYGTNQGSLPFGAPIFGGGPVTPTYNFNDVGYTALGLDLTPGLYWCAFVGVGGGSFQGGNGSAAVVNLLRTIVGGSQQSSIQQVALFLLPSISGQTPGVWPTLTGQYSDFTGFEREFMSATVALRVQP